MKLVITKDQLAKLWDKHVAFNDHMLQTSDRSHVFKEIIKGLSGHSLQKKKSKRK